MNRRAFRSAFSAGLVMVLALAYAVVLPAISPAPARAAEGGLVASRAWGYNEGKFSVSHDGAAEYSLPLWTPKGRNGLQPELALSYNSRGGNGLLGVGWSLSGVSSRITPCPRTVAQDGVRDAVKYNGTDVYCLDGNRLRPTGPGTSTQREYRTERSTFARIISYGSPGAVPTSFKVWSKDGKILSYGVRDASTNGQLLAYPLRAGSSVTNPSLERASTTQITAAWVLHRVEDRNGNAYTIEWASAEGGASAAELWYASMWPVAVHYAPNRRVEFSYQTRTDPIDSFDRGIHTRTRTRINRIRMYAGPTGAPAELLRDYRLTYRNDSTSGRSLLSNVTECDHNAVCLKPLEFQWSLGSYEFDEIDSGVTDAAVSTSTDGRLEVADIDGDGQDDLLYPSVDNRWMGRLGVGNGHFRGPHQIVGDVWPTYKQDVRPVDFDRDGKVDVVAEIVDPNCGCQGTPGNTLPNEYYLFRSTSGAFPEFTMFEPDPDEAHISFWAPGHRDPAYYVDLDGNGLPDYATPRALATTTPWRYRLNTGAADDEDRFAPMVHTDHSLGYLFGPTEENSFVRVLDSDGDGRDELLQLQVGVSPARYETFGINAAGQKDIKRASINVPVTDAYGKTLYLGDFNGDGLKDTVFPFDGLRVQLNSGNGFGPFLTLPAGTNYVEPAPPTTPMFNVGVRIVDFNNDGADDVLVFHDGDPNGASDHQRGIQLYTWRDGGFRRIGLDREAVQLVNGVGFPATDVLDIDGNGVLDIIHLADGDPDFLKVLRRKSNPSDAALVGGGEPDQLIGVGVGTIGPRIEIDYTTLSNRGVHQPGTNCGYPVNCPVRGGSVVVMHKLWNGDGTDAAGWNVFHHRYKAARVDLSGRGWLGFAEHTVIDSRAETTTVTTFDNVTRDTGSPALYPFAQLPKETTVTVNPDADTEYRRTTTNTYALRRLPVAGTYTAENRNTVEIEQERPVGATTWTTMRVPATNREFDLYGNQTRNTVNHFLGRKVTDRTEFRIDETNWLVSQPARQVRTGCTDSEETNCTTREVRFEQFPTGDLKQTVVQPLRSDQKLTTVIGRDSYGNVESEKSTDAAGSSRTVTFEFDADRLHRTTVTKLPADGAAPHVVRENVHSGLGVPLTVTDPNGVTTGMRYDWFGRLRETNRADGSFEHVDHVLSAGAHSTATTLSGGGGHTVELDALGREKTKRVKAFNGASAVTSTSYDQLGRVSTVSRPVLPGDPVVYTTHAYDRLGRLVRKTDPDGVSTRSEYIGLETHTYDGRGIHSYTVKDIEGDVVSSFEDDPLSTNWLKTTFEHGPFGEVTKTVAPDGSTQTMRYDDLGRRIRQSDPSAGVTQSTYTAFGQLRTETDGAGAVSTYTYDALGRTTRIDSPDGRTTYSWDTAPNGIGKLASADSPDNVFTRYSYDEFGHRTVASWKIENETFETITGYDEIGRPASVTYPHVFFPGGYRRLRIDYAYNPSGYLSDVRDAAAPPDALPLWTAQGRDAAGQLTRERQGNAVVTDYAYRPETGLLDTVTTTGPGTVGKLGEIQYGYDGNRNVTLRHDKVNSRYEQYSYDVLNRLERWQARPSATGSIVLANDYDYDQIGNLTKESATRPGQPVETTTYEYGYQHPELDVPRYALVKRNNSDPYTYDGAGRQIDGPNRHVAYTTRGLPRTLDTNNGRHVQFRYDANGARALHRDGGVTTITAGELFERRSPAGHASSEIHNLNNIVVDGRVVAQVNLVQPAGGGQVTATRVFYLHADKQGSTTLVTNPAGQPYGGDESIFANLFYDPWGRRVDAAYQQVPNNRNGGPRQLYTGHYHDDETFLINMKGRMYDPHNRRFLTPDPVVSDPLLGQSHNRYAYVRNNPTTFTDPTGLQAPDGGSFWEWANLFKQIESDKEQDQPVPEDETSAQGLEAAPEADDDATTSGTDSVSIGASVAEQAVEAEGDALVNTPFTEQRTRIIEKEVPNTRFDEVGLIFVYAGTSAGTAAASDGPAPVGDAAGLLIIAGAVGMALRTTITGATTTTTTYEKVTERRQAPLTYITYTMFNVGEGKLYAGRASGYGTPEQVLAARFAGGHHMTGKGYSPAVIDQARIATLPRWQRWLDPSYQAIRGREQQLIDQAGGAMSDVARGRTADPFSLSGNAIRGVSAYNPLGRTYHGQASAQFGEIAPYTGY